MSDGSRRDRSEAAGVGAPRRGAARLTRVAASTFAATAVLVGLLGAPAGAAVPSPHTRADATGEVPKPGGDITSITIVNKATKLVLTFRTRRTIDPSQSPVWNNGNTAAAWSIDTDSDPIEEFIVFLRDGLAPSVRTLDEDVPCPGITSSFTSPNYRVVVPKACLGDPGGVQVRLALNFAPEPPAATLDQAPNAVFTDVIRQQ